MSVPAIQPAGDVDIAQDIAYAKHVYASGTKNRIVVVILQHSDTASRLT